MKQRKRPKAFPPPKDLLQGCRQAFHLPAGLLQAPQSAGGGTSPTNGNDRGSSALCSGVCCCLGQLLLSQPPVPLINWLSEDTSLVMCKEHCSSCLHRAPRLGCRNSLSPRTAREQVISPGSLLTPLFEFCKASPFPSNGGTPEEGWRKRGLEPMYFQRFILIMTTSDTFWDA